MSEDESRRIAADDEQGDDVEAHGKKFNANDEGTGSEDDSDDFEAHSRRTNVPKKA